MEIINQNVLELYIWTKFQQCITRTQHIEHIEAHT